MSGNIVEDVELSFKELEQKVFRYVCMLGCEITQKVLEDYDKKLHNERDKKVYRDKGKRTTSIKTVYGDVTYSRYVYRTKTEAGETAYVYLLDKAMHMEKIGLISTNLAERIAMTVTETPYRETSDFICKTTGQTISQMGVWDLVQKLGERISDEEECSARQMDTAESKGEKVIPILFEEMDGVWLSMQDSRHKKMKKQEMKVSTIYEGWDAESEEQGRSSLVEKKMLAGMEDSKTFHRKREAQIREHYNADEIGYRVLNGDGGSWIRDEYEPDTVFQLDRYHIQQEILRKIKDKEAQKTIRELFAQEKIEEMLEYILIYADSVESDDPADKKSKEARELYKYLNNNRSGLLPWQKQVKNIPTPKDGIVYKNMGVQESQNCTAITMRMKHRRMRWSVRGANNMGKALYRKENKDLIGTIERYTDGLIFALQMQEIVEVLSAAKAPLKDGKGNSEVEVLRSHLPLLDAVQTASRKAFMQAIMC